MLVDFQKGDDLDIAQAVKLHLKMLADARKALVTLRLDTLAVDTAQAEVEAVQQFLGENTQEGAALEGLLDLKRPLALQLEVSLNVLTSELEKVVKKEADLFVPTDATQARIAAVTHLLDRIRGQASLSLEVTRA